MLDNKSNIESINVAEFCENIENKIKQRKEELVQNSYQIPSNIVENRIISGSLASIQGLDKYLKRAQIVKKKMGEAEVPDLHSHGSIKLSSLHDK